MKHLNEEQLILYFYGEGTPHGAAAAEEHLAACAACRGQFQALKRDLTAVERAAPVVPERSESYGAQVWQRLAPRLDERPEPALDWRAWFRLPRLAWAGALAVLLLAAFLAGRFGIPTGRGPETAAVPAEQVRERILIFAVGDHLERSQMLLVELVNAPSNGAVDITAERRRAEDLLDVNRLYRQTAASAGEAGLSEVLDELERTLLEIANSPDELSSADLEGIRKRIESQGILFKVRVLGSQVRERERQAIAQPLGRS